ncbi:MAG: hydrogenase iron-sulfur subunit [Candidatus Bipolaricaulota bacterium]
MADHFEPRIAAFLCQWCAYAGADLAGTSRLEYPPNVIPIRVPCSGRVEPSWVIEALRNGADGVLIGGCHPGDCHYVSGNYKARRRVELLRSMLGELGLDPRRVKLEWVSASEGARFAQVVRAYVEEIRSLGPNEGGFGAPDGAEGAGERIAGAAQEAVKHG